MSNVVGCRYDYDITVLSAYAYTISHNTNLYLFKIRTVLDAFVYCVYGILIWHLMMWQYATHSDEIHQIFCFQFEFWLRDSDFSGFRFFFFWKIWIQFWIGNVIEIEFKHFSVELDPWDSAFGFCNRILAKIQWTKENQ